VGAARALCLQAGSKAAEMRWLDIGPVDEVGGCSALSSRARLDVSLDPSRLTFSRSVGTAGLGSPRPASRASSRARSRIARRRVTRSSSRSSRSSRPSAMPTIEAAAEPRGYPWVSTSAIVSVTHRGPEGFRRPPDRERARRIGSRSGALTLAARVRHLIQAVPEANRNFGADE